jgi:hypothetical protein
MTTTTNQFKYVGQGIKPENFTYVGYYTSFTVPNGEDGYDTEVEFEVDFDKIGVDDPKGWMGNFDPKGNKCSCCNHAIKRGSFFLDQETSDLIYVGFDCTNNIMKYTFDVQGISKQTMAQRKRRLKQIEIAKILASNEGLEETLSVNDVKIREIASKFFSSGKISEKQIEFVKVLAERRRQLELVANEVVVGRYKSLFRVISCKGIVDSYTGSVKYKLLIENIEGKWKAYGNVGSLIGIGEEITATATFKKSDNDPLFGYFSRIKVW